MSGIGSYKYVADDGTTYQVVLPSDFAAILGETPAVGSEPYLPAYLAPRYATYQAQSPYLWRQATITTLALFTNLPKAVTVGGITYQLVSTQSQSTFQVQGGSIMLAAGPQGPTGATGPQGATATNTNFQDLVSSTFTLVNSTATTLVSRSLAAGTYLILGIASFNATSAVASHINTWLGTGGAGSGNIAASNGWCVASEWVQVTAGGIITLASTSTVTFSAESSAGVINVQGGAGGLSSGMLTIQLA